MIKRKTIQYVCYNKYLFIYIRALIAGIAREIRLCGAAFSLHFQPVTSRRRFCLRLTVAGSGLFLSLFVEKERSNHQENYQLAHVYIMYLYIIILTIPEKLKTMCTETGVSRVNFRQHVATLKSGTEIKKKKILIRIFFPWSIFSVDSKQAHFRAAHIIFFFSLMFI